MKRIPGFLLFLLLFIISLIIAITTFSNPSNLAIRFSLDVISVFISLLGMIVILNSDKSVKESSKFFKINKGGNEVLISDNAIYQLIDYSLSKNKLILTNSATLEFLEGDEFQVVISLRVLPGSNIGDLNIDVKDRITNAFKTISDKLPSKVVVKIIEFKSSNEKVN